MRDAGVDRIADADDPLFHTRPPTLEREYTELREGRMLDYSCVEPAWEDHPDSLRQQQTRP